jgi:hypothetical protein
VRKRGTARYSIKIINVQTRRGVLKTSTGADVVRATKIFERQIGEEDIVCRIQSFIMISAHHWVRSCRGYEPFDPRDLRPSSESPRMLVQLIWRSQAEELQRQHLAVAPRRLIRGICVVTWTESTFSEQLVAE